MISYADEIYLQFGADSKIHGATETPAMREIRRKSIEANLKLVPCPVRHLGTEKTQQLYHAIFDHLIKSGVEVRFNSPVEEFVISQNQVKAVKCSDETFYRIFLDIIEMIRALDKVKSGSRER